MRFPCPASHMLPAQLLPLLSMPLGTPASRSTAFVWLASPNTLPFFLLLLFLALCTNLRIYSCSIDPSLNSQQQGDGFFPAHTREDGLAAVLRCFLSCFPPQFCWEKQGMGPAPALPLGSAPSCAVPQHCRVQISVHVAAPGSSCPAPRLSRPRCKPNRCRSAPRAGAGPQKPQLRIPSHCQAAHCSTVFFEPGRAALLITAPPLCVLICSEPCPEPSAAARFWMRWQRGSLAAPLSHRFLIQCCPAPPNTKSLLSDNDRMFQKVQLKPNQCGLLFFSPWLKQRTDSSSNARWHAASPRWLPAGSPWACRSRFPCWLSSKSPALSPDSGWAATTGL